MAETDAVQGAERRGCSWARAGGSLLRRLWGGRRQGRGGQEHSSQLRISIGEAVNVEEGREVFTIIL